jgi:hypothetical protein
MKQKLLALLAVLLTGGMLVACGPGDGTETVEGGGGVVDEPIGGFETADPFAEDTADDAGAFGEAETEVEGETVELEPEEGVTAEGELADETTAEGAEDEAAAEEPVGDEVAGGGAAAPAAGEPIVVTLSQAAEGVAVANVEGAEDPEAVAAMDQDNPDLNLTVGERYEFVYDGEGDLVFLNSNDEPLLSTAGAEGTFATDAEVAAEAQDGRISFTMTDALAQEIDHYAAGPDQQGGAVNAN